MWEHVVAAGAGLVEQPAQEVSVLGLSHGLDHVLQGVLGVGLLQQGQGQLTAPPAGQVVQRQQAPAQLLWREWWGVDV